MDEAKNPWKISGSKEVYDNKWISLTEYEVINPSGGHGIYGKVHFKNIAVGIIPLDEEMNTYLVGQYRFTVNEYSWEIPEGGCPENTDILEAAKRELLEETGLTASFYSRILSMHLSNSVSDEYCEVFVARGLQQFEAMPEETEQLVIKKIPFKEVYEMVLKGDIKDAVSVTAILKLQLLMNNGSLP